MMMAQHITRNRSVWNDKYYLRLAHLYANYAKGELMKSKEPHKNPTCLDVGCGFGETMKAMKEVGIDAVGIDIDESCIKIASSFGQVKKLDAGLVSTRSQRIHSTLQSVPMFLSILKTPSKC